MVFQRIHPLDRVLAQQVMEGVSTSGIDFEHEYRLVMPSGAIKYVQVRAHALHDSSGNIEFVGAVTDITERKLPKKGSGAKKLSCGRYWTSRLNLLVFTDPNVNVSTSTASHLITSGLLLKSGARRKVAVHSFIQMTERES